MGLIDKAPIFDQVIQDWDAKMSTDPSNEKFTAFEFGLNTNSNDGTMISKLNLYSTAWNDRIATRTVINEDGDDDIIYLTGINQSHTGVEVEFSAQINEMFRVVGAGLGNWVYTDDATGTYRDSDGSDASYSYALKDLKVGDMPQGTLALGITASPVEDSKVQLLYEYYAHLHYADWNPTSREFSDDSTPDRNQSWRAPKYGILDLNASYKLPFEFSGVKPELFLNVRNLLDAVYIQDATDNSRFNAEPFESTTTALTAMIFLGLLPTNLGLKVNF